MKKILLTLPMVAFVGCASLSSYQEARVLAPGKATTAIGYTGYSDDYKRVAFQDSTGFNMPLIEWSARVGVFKNLDIGLKYTFIGSLSGDVKYQLLGQDSGAQFQLSTGLKGAYSQVQAPVVLGDDVKSTLTDIIVPVYATYAPVSWASFTLEPQFCYRLSDKAAFYPEGPIAGANVDLRLGDSYGIIGEVGYHKHLSKDFSQMNYGAMLYTPVTLEGLLSGVLKSFL